MSRRGQLALWLGLVSGCTQSASPLRSVVDAELPAACGAAEDCSDGLFCNGEEQCEEGRCVAGTAPRCDDGDRCTLDGCSEGRGCVSRASSAEECVLDASEPDAGVVEARGPARGEDSDGGVGLDAAPADAALHTAPLDQARAPAIECPSSVRALRATSQEELAAYGRVVCVEGDVMLGKDLLDLSGLSQLRRIGGSFAFAGAGAALRGLAALQRVDGDVSIGAADVSDGMDLAALQWVGRNLKLGARLAPDALAALRYVGGTLQVVEPPAVSPRALQALAFVGGDLTLNGALPEGLPALEVVGGRLGVTPRWQIRLEPLPRLRLVGGDLSVENSALERLALPALERVAGELTLALNRDLSHIALPALAAVGALRVQLNPLLSRCEVDALRIRLRVEDQAPSVGCNLGCVRCAGEACLEPGAVTAGQNTTLSGAWNIGLELSPLCFRTVEYADSLSFYTSEVEQLPALSLRRANLVQVMRTALRDLSGLAALEAVQVLNVYNNPALLSLHGLERLATIDDQLNLHDNTALTDVGALDPAREGALQHLGGKVYLYGNRALDQCQVDALLLQAGDASVSRHDDNASCAGGCLGAQCSSDASIAD